MAFANLLEVSFIEQIVAVSNNSFELESPHDKLLIPPHKM